MDLIIYHAKCTDGWTAAYVAKKKYPNAQLLPASFSQEPPFEICEGKDVLVVDFSWKTRADNIKLNLLSESFRILDHHKSSEELLAGLDFATFDKTRSGAGLAWDYLFGKDSGVKASNWEGVDTYWARPWYVNYVEDYDTWQFKLPRSREINAYLHTQPHTIEAWDAVAELDPTMATRFGIGAVQQIDYQVRALASIANSGQGWGCTVAIVNAPYFMASDLGHELAKTHEVAVTWYRRQDGLIVFSLRSIGDIDVSKIAVKLGGGGHKNSAGFEMNELCARDLIQHIIKAGPR